MSRSPGKNIRRASASLEEAFEAMERHQEARDQVAAQLGPVLMAELGVARDALARAAERVSDGGGPAGTE